MNNYLEGAKPSPRIANGNIYWYEGDTFSFPLQIELRDANGYEKTILSNETLNVSFYNSTGISVLTKEYSNIENNTITISIDSTETALFQAGRYALKIRLKSNLSQATISSHIDVIVQ